MPKTMKSTHTHKHAKNQDEQNVWQNFKSKVAATAAALAPAITGKKKCMPVHTMETQRKCTNYEFRIDEIGVNSWKNCLLQPCQ